MSAKWVRSKRWDDEHLRGALVPVKWVLRAFSSIPLAVVLLTLVSLYGVLASVPLGLLALIPTWLVYASTVLAAIGVLAVLPTWGAVRWSRRLGAGPGGRFAIWVLGMVVLSVAACALWYVFAWPVLRYDAVKGTGLRFFASFVESHQSLQFRRLPGVEMSELEFYAWWPLSVLLGLFVINLIVATLRRIEFDVPRIGVITVHTGIVTIALGSIVYAGLKQEGDTLLAYGGIDQAGRPLAGPAVNYFYDNNDTALWISEAGATAPPGMWEQRRLRGVPRYNDYNLDAIPRGMEREPGVIDRGALDVRVPDRAGEAMDRAGVLAQGVRFRVVGYAGYAELERRWVEGERVPGAGEGRLVREVEVWLTDSEGKASDAEGGGRAGDRPRMVHRFIPSVPAERVEVVDGVLAMEYTIGMGEERWRDLQSSIPDGTPHALVIEHPSSGYRNVFPIREGVEIPVGQTGFRVRVERILERPPFPIITRGYEGATSSVVVARVFPPAGADGSGGGAFERWVYHRFPEISQDLGVEDGGSATGGMSGRRDADPVIRLSYIDASIVQVYFDESALGEGGAGDQRVRALVRHPGGRAVVTPTLEVGEALQVAPRLRMRLGERSESAVRVEVPVVVPEVRRDRRLIGTHQASALAVEVIEEKAGVAPRVVWLPFTQYVSVDARNARTVTLSDGRSITLAFGRVRHALPMALRLKDFEMIPYPHSQTPRDYRSDVVVMSRWNNVLRDEMRKTSLNDPLLVRVPFQERPDVPGPINMLGRAVSTVIPVQYKFSQAGWDQSGWRESVASVERGEAERPHARFTILGVGNNPGIYVIAAGAIMMSVGIPWAFYLKPVLVKRRKRKLQMQLAREGKLPARVARELGIESAGMNGVAHEREAESAVKGGAGAA